MQFRKTVTLTILYYDTGEDKWMARDTDENYVLLDEEALSDWEVLSDA